MLKHDIDEIVETLPYTSLDTFVSLITYWSLDIFPAVAKRNKVCWPAVSKINL